MRSQTGFLLAAALLVGSAVSPTFAEARTRDQVYADSFGNLVIESAAGFKRILVGEGKLAKQLSDYVDAGQPKVEYYRESDSYVEPDCYRPPVFVKGRSYMYGLADGEMPQLSPCR
jgi:hypothetical protein